MTGTGKRNWPPRVHHLVQVKRRVRHQKPRNPRGVATERTTGPSPGAKATTPTNAAILTPVQKAHDEIQGILNDQDDQDGHNGQNSQDGNGGGLIGGCAGTRYGCCPDGVTARNETGSNCPGAEPVEDPICTEETDVVFVGPNRTPVIGQCINENGTLVCRFQNTCS